MPDLTELHHDWFHETFGVHPETFAAAKAGPVDAAATPLPDKGAMMAATPVASAAPAMPWVSAVTVSAAPPDQAASTVRTLPDKGGKMAAPTASAALVMPQAPAAAVSAAPPNEAAAPAAQGLTKAEIDAAKRRPAVKHPVVETKADNPTGMKAKAAPERQYGGEHNSMAWRAADEADRAIPTAVTRLYSEQETKANTLTSDGQGGFTRGDGAAPRDGAAGYAMDPKTGKMVTFEQNRTLTAPGVEHRVAVPDLMTGLVMAAKSGIKGARVEMGHHTTPLAAMW